MQVMPWFESERRIEFLRSGIAYDPSPPSKAFLELWNSRRLAIRNHAWFRARMMVEKVDRPEPRALMPVAGPSHANIWFKERWSHAVAFYGDPFLDEEIVPGKYANPIRIPQHLNVDFFAAILGGDPDLGHQVVYHTSQQRWYFYEPRIDAYQATTEGKFKALLSNLLMRASQACGNSVEKSRLMVEFRNDATLSLIVSRARSLHAVSPEFLPEPRTIPQVRDKEQPELCPSVSYFAADCIVKAEGNILTYGDCYNAYEAYCRSNNLLGLPTGKTAEEQLVEAIRATHSIGMRKDREVRRTKVRSWTGIALAPRPADLALVA